jgi:hypothetical protein
MDRAQDTPFVIVRLLGGLGNQMFAVHPKAADLLDRMQ